MTPSTKQRFLAHADRLIVEGKSVLKTEVIDHDWLLGENPTPAYVDSSSLTKWFVGCRNLVIQLGEQARAWESSFEEPQACDSQSIASPAKMRASKCIQLREAVAEMDNVHYDH